MKPINAIIYDTEVNSLEHMEPIEVAWMEVDIIKAVLDNGHNRRSEQRYKPEKPIDMASLAVHLIMPEELDHCPPSSEATIPDCNFVIGHNIDFDEKVMKKANDHRICTLALSRHLWPELSSHKLAVIFLTVSGVSSDTIAQVRNAHNAMSDVIMTYYVLHEIVSRTGVCNVEELHSLSEIARIPTVMPFGKPKGMPISDVPSDYVRWLLRQPDVDSYLRTALEKP